MSEATNTQPYYAPEAYRGYAIPPQRPMEEKTGVAKAIEAGDFIQRLPWGNYAGLDLDLEPSAVKHYQARLEEDRDLLQQTTWTHKKRPKDAIKGPWQMLLTLAGAFADKGMIKVFLAIGVFGAVASPIAKGDIEYIWGGIGACCIFYGLHLTFRFPFLWLLKRYPGLIIKDLGCGYFRPTGIVRFRTWKEETFEAPFIEFDAYIQFIVMYNGPVSYKLVLQHRYSGWQTTVATVGQAHIVELHAEWDQLQRYMDVTLPIPDIPNLEPYRHLDPTTKAFDDAGKRGVPADYWATLDLDWWTNEGYPAHRQKIEEFPWNSLEDKMEHSVPNLREAAMV